MKRVLHKKITQQLLLGLYWRVTLLYGWIDGFIFDTHSFTLVQLVTASLQVQIYDER